MRWKCMVYRYQGGDFKATSQFNISNMAAGLYLYKMFYNGMVFPGKIIKL